VAREIDEQTELGDVYIRSLVRSQLRLALVVLAVLAVALGGLPLVFTLLPGVAAVHVFAIPLPWVLLGALVYPALVALGWFYTRQAERNEREFTDLVDRR
jgi:membrane protein implicated in regulation of membrane protease activity